MNTKLPCGCKHNDTEWLYRCGGCAAQDEIDSARWANDRLHPPVVKVHRINGVLQSVAYMAEVEQVSPEVVKAMIPPLQEPPADMIKGDIYKAVAAKILQEDSCPEPPKTNTSGSPISSVETTEDYKALLGSL